MSTTNTVPLVGGEGASGADQQTQPPQPHTAGILTDQAATDTTDPTAAAAALVPPVVSTTPAAAALQGYPGAIVFATPPPATVQPAVIDPTTAVQASLDDQPTYVNPKQYHRILKRREKRKKLTGSDVISYTPRKRSYMHESRHKHAVARKRGVGGRFLSKKKEEDDAAAVEHVDKVIKGLAKANESQNKGNRQKRQQAGAEDDSTTVRATAASAVAANVVTAVAATGDADSALAK